MKDLGSIVKWKVSFIYVGFLTGFPVIAIYHCEEINRGKGINLSFSSVDEDNETCKYAKKWFPCSLQVRYYE